MRGFEIRSSEFVLPVALPVRSATQSDLGWINAFPSVCHGFPRFILQDKSAKDFISPNGKDTWAAASRARTEWRGVIAVCASEKSAACFPLLPLPTGGATFGDDMAVGRGPGWLGETGGYWAVGDHWANAVL